MLIDEVTVKIQAGNGGDGAVAFNKNMGSLGPAGASGGKGGSVYCEGISDLGALRHFLFKKSIVAQTAWTEGASSGTVTTVRILS